MGATPASIHSMKLYGIPRSEVLHHLTKTPMLPKDFVLQTLEEYFLLYCTNEHFTKNQHCGRFYKNNKEYIILYHECTRWDVTHFSGQISMSFRTAKPEYNLPSYVIVTL
jgi:hypothetical protein